MDKSYIFNHLGEDADSYLGAVVPPIFQTTNFRFKTVEQARKAFRNEFEVPVYTRGTNPTVKILRQKIAALEQTEDALILSSGSAAVAAALMSQLKAGDHVVCVKKPYGWTAKLLNVLLKKFNIETTFIDGGKIENWEQARRENTKIFYLESPNSWTFEIQDLKAVCDLARTHKITTVIDNSCATPLSQRPIESGVDLIIHSASKYLSGHSDVVAGVICGSKKMLRDIFYGPYMTLGGVISPHDAWLMMRGLRTLEIRYNRSSDSAEKVVAYLDAHSQVAQVIYSHSTKHSQHALAKKQMLRGGGLFSIVLKATSIPEIEKFCESLKFFQMAVSWGGYESLVFPACVFHSGTGSSAGDLPANMVRFYVGLEEPEVLIRDLEQALKF
jgi:cystathionine beta-lyase/cystathionine gamma-synthase